MDDCPALSIVIPVYNSADTIERLLTTLDGMLVPGGHEVILVNDGSADNSAALCERFIAQARTPMTLLEHSRNFGEHNAVLTGLRAARGAYVVTMDDDFQNPPHEVLRLLDYTRQNRFAVVYTAYAEKRHAPWRNLGSRFANWCADYLLDKPRGLYLSSFRCMDAFTAANVAEYQGPFPYVDGLILQITQNIGVLEVDHNERENGVSNYTLGRLFRLWLNVVLNFSLVPLRVTWLLGLAGFLLGIAAAGLAMTEIDSDRQAARSILVGSLVLIASGAQMATLGLIGEYLGRLHLTVNRKPQSVVQRTTSNRAATAAADLPRPAVRSA